MRFVEHIFKVRLSIWTCNISLKYDCQSGHVIYHCAGLPFVRQCSKNNDFCTIFEEDAAQHVRVG